MQHILRALAGYPETARMLAAWSEQQQAILDTALTLQAVPAPSFAEAQRAGAVRDRFSALGLADVGLDDVGNVYGRTAGRRSGGPALLISAHLDTVFPADTDLTARQDRDAGRIYAPGIGDNSLGLAALIHTAQALSEHAVQPACDIWWVATVGEEGLGDLRGMRRVCGRLGGTIGVGLVLEGIGLGRVYYAGLGVRRLRVSVSGPGGHSWLHAERPSAAHHLLRIGAALVERIRPPEQPRATFNIGVIEGGTSINTRAADASLWIDLRAVDAATLGRLEAQARSVIGEFEDEAELSVTTEVVGDRPSAALPVGHPLVRAAQAALQVAGYNASPPEVGSTDANALLAAAIPAVCIGITTGGNAHTLDEYIDTGPLATGMRQLTLLALLAAEHAEEWQRWRAADGR